MRKSYEHIAILAVALAFALVIIFLPHSASKLNIPPLGDDANYMYDSLVRYERMAQGGMGEFGRLYLANPPHVPVIAIGEVALMAAFGPNQWSPYLVNGIYVFAFLLVANWLLSPLRAPARWLCLLALLTVPMLGMAIYEIRPDFGLGFCLATGALLVLDDGPRDSLTRRRLGAGCFWLASLIVKPMYFMVAGATVCVFLPVSYWLYGRGTRLRRQDRPVLMVFSFVACAVLFHWIVAFGEIMNYLQYVLWGTGAQLWWKANGLVENVLFHVMGPSGKTELGRHAAIIIGGIAVVAYLVSKKRLKPARAFFALLGGTFVFYLMATVPEKKYLYSGLSFQIMLVYTLLWSMARLSTRSRSELALSAAALFLGAIFWQTPRTDEFAGASLVEHELSNDAARRVVEALLPLCREPQRKFFAPMQGRFSPIRLGWMARMAGGRCAHLRVNGPGEFNRLLVTGEAGSLVLASEPDARGFAKESDYGRHAAEYLEQLRKSPAYRLHARISDGGSSSFYLYERTRP